MQNAAMGHVTLTYREPCSREGNQSVFQILLKQVVGVVPHTLILFLIQNRIENRHIIDYRRRPFPGRIQLRTVSAVEESGQRQIDIAFGDPRDVLAGLDEEEGMRETRRLAIARQFLLTPINEISGYEIEMYEPDPAGSSMLDVEFL